jgi:hypothetical protein
MHFTPAGLAASPDAAISLKLKKSSLEGKIQRLWIQDIALLLTFRQADSQEINLSARQNRAGGLVYGEPA